MALQDSDSKHCIYILQRARRILKTKFRPGAYVSGVKLSKIEIVSGRYHDCLDNMRRIDGCDALGAVALIIRLNYSHADIERRLDYLYGIEHYLQQASVYLSGWSLQDLCDLGNKKIAKKKIHEVFGLALRAFRDKSRSPNRRHPSYGVFGR